MRTTVGGTHRRLDVVVAKARPRRSTRAIVLLAAIVSIVAIALADYATGTELSLSIFYVVPIVAVTVGISSSMGFCLAAAASVAWTLADASITSGGRSTWLQTWNGALWFCTVSLVVALLSALRRTLGDAQASERRSKEFLAYAAHQLRTPIAALRATAEALVLTGFQAQREQLASNLIIEANRMGRLVTSLLRLTRLDQGDPLESRPCDVEPIVGAELERLRVLAPDLDVRLWGLARPVAIAVPGPHRRWRDRGQSPRQRPSPRCHTYRGGPGEFVKAAAYSDRRRRTGNSRRWRGARI